MPGFNHIRVRKSYSRDTIMVSPVDENGADRYADASNPHVVQAVSHATIVDDECNGGIPNTHVAYQYLADALGSVRVLRRGPEMSGGPEPRPTLPGRIKAQTMVRFIDLTAWNSDEPDNYWRTRPIMSLLPRPQGATRTVLNTSFDPRHPRLREASFSAYFLGQREVVLIFTPYERVQTPPPSKVVPMSATNSPTGTPGTPIEGQSPRTSSEKRMGFITSNIPPEDRWLGMINDLMYALSECFQGTTCKFTLVGLDTIPTAALNLDPALADDWITRREKIRKYIGRQVNFTRGVYPPQPPIPADQLAALIKDIDILTRDEYRQQVGQEEFDLVTVW
ncbi:hypothetical protein CcaverHIS002_0510830 [Cutaneotrichosporon cavernicola]|uniref:Uncharacterized protein n=1 Tax=Cutaneotrichosporon cavernicola TaxID=279322 RepID=A0AA48QXM7_9TREE|nr:uncharacterized protein CcaverHIS019_0511400 [Cutaneotrichosporon cavernicola]BEI85682.1 hypothetical protein CcaverHIS002_0510830 [Cutaneotrichosporon cavernicola]BEI93512.1 hypothetical protein CcaverHIS019_0511400 [Cutaneotrichosporon cavernicola]BEJ01291.1 hypothetical protein CcaverHIS631_0511480 [Cutaneotrichosporon cavernicola]BEJ09057.1 hypothetical protein CcaverHIS641_0511510 [Cutaneotrichosporon cavernicola]